MRRKIEFSEKFLEFSEKILEVCQKINHLGERKSLEFEKNP